MNERGAKVVLGLTGVIVGTTFATLGARLTALHLSPLPSSPELRVVVPAQRGRILDRHGVVLAMDVPAYRLNADPKAIAEEGTAEAYARVLQRILGLDPDEVRQQLSRTGRRQVYLAHGLTRTQRDHVRATKLRHLWFDETYVRQHPLNELAAHVVGFVNAEGVGAAGIEHSMDRFLRGTPGLRVIVQDGRRREIRDSRRVDIQPEPGATVTLTLDVNLQTFAEEALDEAVRQHNALGGWAIVMDVRTGEILAMTSRPTFDLNRYNESSEDQRLNRAVGYVYEPGSIFKVATIAAALNEGVVQPDSEFDCENGLWVFRGRPMRDFHPYGRLTVRGIIQKSSNIGAAKITDLLGEARLEKYLTLYGFGRPTGVGLPGEETGLLRLRSQWDSLTATRIAFGHSIGVTGLQMVMLLSMIGHDGVLMRPAVVQRVTDARGQVLMEFVPTELARPLRPEVARRMREMMVAVTEEGGTGRRAAIPGVPVAGKTGTAIKVGPSGYDSRRNIASFMGLVPADQPRFAILVSVDEPQPEHTGGVVAAPVFRRIAEQALRYAGITPSPATRPLEVPLPASEPEDRGHVDWPVM